MKLSDYLEDYYTFSGKASDHARTAAFAGLGVIWIFKIDAQPTPRVPAELVLPAGLFVLALGLDLLHYVLGAMIWGLFHWWYARQRVNAADDPELEHGWYLVAPLTLLFWAKIAAVIAGYFFLGQFVLDKWQLQAVP